MIKAIVFDLDNTLYNEADYFRETYKKIGEYLSGILKENSSVIKNELMEILENFGDKRVFDIYIKKRGLDIEVKNKMIEIYRAADVNIILKKNALNLLKFLRTKHLKIGLLTNGGEKTQVNKIRNLKLENLFDEIVITGKELKREHWKPNKKAFKLILERLRVEPEEIIYIGDNPKTDLGGLKLKIKTILVNNKYLSEEKYKEVLIFKSLDDVFYFLIKLNGE
ncbi:MAG: HAD family hydrolase [Fusobacterium sp. JB021]|nr:HAD family hydrolase [Fusobacterium sp. JB021]